MPPLSHSPPETLHLISRALLLVRIFHYIRDALKGCNSLYRKSPSLYEITNVVVIQLLNTSNELLLNDFPANSFSSDRAIYFRVEISHFSFKYTFKHIWNIYSLYIHEGKQNLRKLYFVNFFNIYYTVIQLVIFCFGFMHRLQLHIVYTFTVCVLM